MANPCDCFSAEEFLEKISPIGNFKSEEPNSWLFRGQGQDWPLVPSLFRKSGIVEKLIEDDINDPDIIRKAERQLVIDFFNIADRRGLILPDDSQRLRNFLSRLDIEGKIEDEALSVMALAQHYGIPTRLLDWTWQSFIAAFFAAEDAYKNNKKYEPSSCLVVWAFYFPEFTIGLAYDDYVVRGVTAPSASNANLKAQQGVFTLCNEKYAKDEKGDYIAFDVLVDKWVGSLRQHLENDRMFKAKWGKFTLPVSEAEHLLYLLAKSDITPSSIYPGYHSIVEDMKNQKMWEKR
jgi:hypothetical protein